MSGILAYTAIYSIRLSKLQGRAGRVLEDGCTGESEGGLIHDGRSRPSQCVMSISERSTGAETSSLVTWKPGAGGGGTNVKDVPGVVLSQRRGIGEFRLYRVDSCRGSSDLPISNIRKARVKPFSGQGAAVQSGFGGRGTIG